MKFLPSIFMMIVMFSCYGMNDRALMERRSNLDTCTRITSGLGACFCYLGCSGGAAPMCVGCVLYLVTCAIVAKMVEIDGRLHDAPPEIPQQINEQALLEAGVLENTESGLRLRLNISHESELNPQPAHTREVRDSAGPQEQQPRFYQRSSIENWRRIPGTTDPQTRLKMADELRTLSSSISYWQDKISMARFVELLKENDPINRQAHTAFWTELYSLGAALGLPREQVEQIVHNFPQDYPELVEVIAAFERALAPSVPVPAPQTME